MTQKIFNTLTTISFTVSAAVVAGAVYVCVNKDAIVESVKAEATAALLENSGQLGRAMFSPEVETPSVPSLPFGN